MSQTLRVIRGNTVRVPVSIYNSDGSEYTLTSADTLRFTAKKDPYDSSLIFDKTITTADNAYDSTLHAYVFTIEPGDTLLTDFGEYVYDVGIQQSNAYYTLIECAPFILAFNVSKQNGG